MISASQNDNGKASVTDNHSGLATRPPRVTTKVATPLHRATVGRWRAMLLIAAGAQVLALSPLQAASAKKGNHRQRHHGRC